MVEIKKMVYNSAFFIYNLKIQTIIRPNIKIKSTHETSMPLIISAIFLFNRDKVVIINIILSDIQNLG